jgi:hypothetical protein
VVERRGVAGAEAHRDQIVSSALFGSGDT